MKMSVIREYRLKSANGYKIMCEQYNSAAEVVADCKTRKITDRAFHDMADGNLGGEDKKWCGVDSYEQALEYLEKGYQPVVDKLKFAIKANFSGQGKRISFHNDIVGYAPVVPLAIMGVPNAMVNSHMKQIKAKVVDVYYDGVFGCGVSSDKIIATGSKVIAMILQLEQQGYRFNLYQVQSYSDEDDCDMMTVKLKDAAQPLDLKRISFPLTHTGFFRVIGFDWYSKTPKGKYRACYGHALCHEGKVTDKLGDIFKEMFGGNAVYISGNKLWGKGDDGEKYLQGVFTKCGQKA